MAYISKYDIIRSTLQKAVRRGNLNLVEKCCRYLIKKNDSDWLKRRLFAIVFEECWGYTYKLNINSDLESVIYEYKIIAGLAKNRNASGLGVLGYELSEGNKSVLQHDSGDTAIRKIAKGLKDPGKFWKWIERLKLSDKQILMVYKAHKGYSKASRWDKAMALAAAYLAVKDKIPQIKQVTKKTNMPLWVALDKHTVIGRKAIRSVAKSEGTKYNIAKWYSFYFESVISNESKNCYWWNREKEWRFNSLGISIQEAEEIWNKLKPKVRKLLKTESNNLKKRLSRN